MKLMKYSWLAALPMIFTACQEDVLVKEQQQDKIYTLSATMDKGAAMSRAQIQFGNEDADKGEIFLWNEGDAFDMYQYVDDAWVKSTFTIQNYSEEKASASASFSTSSSVKAGVGFKAFYPASDMQHVVSHYLPSGILFSENPENEWADYFKTSMLMEASADSLDAENPTVSFRHLCSLARITYTNQTGSDQVLTYFGLNGYHKDAFGTNYHYDLRNDSSSVDTVDKYGLHVERLSVAEGESIDLYLLFFPMEFIQDGKLQVFINRLSVNDQVNKLTTSDLSVSVISDANNKATGFEAGKRYWFQVTETANGLEWTKDVNQGEGEDVPTVTLANKELAKALYAVLGADKVSFDADSCGLMLKKDVLEVTELNFNEYEGTITSLANGIEFFTNLTKLECRYKRLETCDLSNNTQLTYVDVQSNALETINLMNCTELDVLLCQYNDLLHKVDLTGCTNISNLQAQGTALKELHIPNPKAMTNYLLPAGVSIDLSQYVNLTGLGLSDRGLVNLDMIPANIKAQLGYLKVDHNKLASLDLREFPKLWGLDCGYNNLTEMDLSCAPGLTDLHASENELEGLDITPLSKLENLTCGNQKENINLNLKMTAAQKTEWDNNWSNSWTNENVTVVVAGTPDVVGRYITIQNQELSVALQDVLGTDKVTIDSISGYGIMKEKDVLEVTSLDLSDYEGVSNITSLEGLENFVNLEQFSCEHASLSGSLTMINSKLQSLYLGHNDLTSLDVSGLPDLKDLYCSVNYNLSNLVLPDTETLEILDITATGITSVNLTQYPKLKEFYCQQNNIESIDLSNCPDLSLLYINGNKLTELDLTNHSKIEHLYCDGQQDNRILTLLLHADLMDKWNNEWKDSFVNVILGETVVTIKNKELTAALYVILGPDKVTIDSDYGYGIMEQDVVSQITELNLSNYTGTITSLANGIEFFKNLTTLDCRNVGLVTCDLSKNTKLVYVDLQSNALTTLNLMNCTALEQLFCPYNHELYKIDLTGCSKIWNLQAQGTALKELNIPNPKAMDNFLLPAGVSIDLTQYVNLTGLGLSDRGLVNLDMIPTNIKTQLGYLMIDNNNLTTLDLKEFPNLWGIDCSYNNLTGLDLSYGPNLTYLFCYGNKMKTLDISSLSNLGNLLCGLQKDNQVLTLTLTKAQKTVWEEFWEDNGGCNENVIINVIGGGNSGSNNTSGSDFTIEGIY